MLPLFARLQVLLRILVLSVALGVLLFLAPLPRVYAATINVDDDCSLANAIRSANGDAQSGAMNSCETGDSGADTINFTRDVALTEALPAITSDMTLEGNKRTLRRDSSAGDMRLLHATGTGSLTINDLTLRDGRPASTDEDGYGGAILISTRATTINGSAFIDNAAPVSGGAIAADSADVSISSSTFIGNSTSGAVSAGGAISAETGGTVSITGSSFRSNSAIQGGAIDAQAGVQVTVRRSDFRNNRTDTAGGGAISAHTSLTVRASAFVGNRAGREGGALSSLGLLSVYDSAFIFNEAVGSGGAIVAAGQTTIENSTMFGNRLTNLFLAGAAIAVSGDAATLRHVTVLNSRSGPVSVQAVQGATLNMVNSVIARSSVTDCGVSADSSIGTNINNWIEDGTCSAAFSGDPMLSTPRGSPAFIPPYIGSGLVDAVPDDANCLATDQRGTARPVGAACDIGAYEGAIPRPTPETAGARSPTPARSTCETGLSAAVTVSGIVDGTQCQQVDAAGVGNQQVIAAGFITAVDVWGYLGAGATVCFEGEGRVVFLDAGTSPRRLTGLGSEMVNGRTCAWLDRAGTAVLIPGDSALNPPLAPSLARAAAAGRQMLTNCMVTATARLNLRIGPGDRVIGVVPDGSTLTALSRVYGWFEVDYIGVTGWISADFVATAGNCG